MGLGGQHREAVEATPRRAMTPARRAAVLQRYDGRCARCEAVQGLEIDHVVPLELGGPDELHNLQPLCEPHHKAKTRLDVKLIAKARRLRKADERRARKASKPGRKMQSRGFDKSRRRKMNGTVERRA